MREGTRSWRQLTMLIKEMSHRCPGDRPSCRGVSESLISSDLWFMSSESKTQRNNIWNMWRNSRINIDAYQPVTKYKQRYLSPRVTYLIFFLNEFDQRQSCPFIGCITYLLYAGANPSRQGMRILPGQVSSLIWGDKAPHTHSRAQLQMVVSHQGGRTCCILHTPTRPSYWETTLMHTCCVVWSWSREML